MDSNSVQVLTTSLELASSIVGIISAAIYAGATIFAASVAIYGINSWRREFKGKRQIELAEDVLSLFYEARDAISAIRNPLSWGGEGSTREPIENEDEQEKKVRNRAYIVYERFEKRQSIFNKLYSIRYRFMAQIGKKEAEPFILLRKIVNEIMMAGDTLSQLWLERIGLPKSEKKEITKIIKEYEVVLRRQGSKDEISKRVDKIVADIENSCSKIIRRK